MQIRQAQPGDLPVLLQFEQGVIEAERPFDPTLKEDPVRYYNLNEMLRADHICLLVAEEAGVLLGCGYARIETSKPYLMHAQHAYLGFMYVVPAHRGRGINRQIMTALEAWVKTKGVKELRLEVYRQNAAAIRAYEKAGFTAHMLEMRKPC